MSLKKSFTVLSIFCGLLILPHLVAAQGTQATLPSIKESSSVNLKKKELLIDFPEVEGWRRGEIVRLPDVRLGYGVNYDSEDAGRVTIYVYDMGRRDISDDVESEVIKNEIERAKAEVYAVGQMGYYQDIRELKNEVVTLGGQSGKRKARHVFLNFNAGGKLLNSEIYLLGHQNYFFKVRATYAKTDGSNENKALSELLMAMEKTLNS